MRGILLTCLLVATFQQPIGNSMQGLVMQHTVRWCEGFALPILIEQQMLSGENGATIGGAQSNYYPVPKTEAEQNPTPSPGTSAPTWAP